MMEMLLGLASPSDPGNTDPTGSYLGNMIDPATAKQFEAARNQQGLLGLSQGLLAGNGRVGQTFGDGLAAGLQSMMTQQNALPGQALQSAQANSAMGAGLLNRAQAASTIQEMQDIHKMSEAGPPHLRGVSPEGSAPKSFAEQNAGGLVAGSPNLVPGTAKVGPLANVAMDAFKQNGASDAFIRAALAHGQAEGGFFEPWKKALSNENSFGHWQLNKNGELPGYQNFAGNNTDTATQAKFLMARMEQAVPGITQTDDVNKAMDAITSKFERYKGHGPGQRREFLAKIDNWLGNPVSGSAQADQNMGAPASTLTGDASRVAMASAPPGMVKINSKGVPYAAEIENIPPEEKAKQAEAYAAIKQGMAAGAPPPQVPQANRQFGGILPGAQAPAGGPAPAVAAPQGRPQGIVNFGGPGPVGVGANGYETYTPSSGGAPLPPGITQDILDRVNRENYTRTLYKRPIDPYSAALGTYGIDIAKARETEANKAKIGVDSAGPTSLNTNLGKLRAEFALAPQVEAAKTGAINSTNNQLGVAGNPVWETHPITIGGKTVEMSAPKFVWNQGIPAVIAFNQGQSQPGPGTMVPSGAPVGGPPAAMPPATGPAPMVAPQPAPAGPRPMLPLPPAGAAPAPAVGAGGPAVTDRPFIGKPSYTPQQESEQKGVGDKLAAQRQEIMDQGATAQAANVNLFNMRQAAQDLYTGKGGEAFAELTKYLRLVDPKWNGSVTKAETFVKDGGNLLRQAVKDTSSRAAVQEYKLIGETLPTLATSPQGIQTLLGELQGFNDYKFAKAKAMDSWLADPTHQGSIAGFETQFHQTLNPYTFIALRMSPEDLGQMVSKLSGTDAGKRAISKLTADMNFVKENKLEPDM